MQTKTDEKKKLVTSKVCWGNEKWKKAKKQQEKAGAKRKLNKTISRNIRLNDNQLDYNYY
jgi:hypothetical protein